MEQEMTMTYGRDYNLIPETPFEQVSGKEVIKDIFCKTIQFVNVHFVGNRYEWILVDAGMPHSADEIIDAAEKRFSVNSRPNAIVLTHGHFDHVGAVIELVKYWGVTVFAHELELPYLTGQKSYPPPSPSAEDGEVAQMSPLYPKEPIDLGDKIKILPSNGSVPGLPDWHWIHTPGHTPGHISLFRVRDRMLIAGDAFATVNQAETYKVDIRQNQEISGPPKYFTADWYAAWESVRKLKALKPTTAITGHGMPMYGKKLTKSLQMLVRDFGQVAIPEYGRYIQ